MKAVMQHQHDLELHSFGRSGTSTKMKVDMHKLPQTAITNKTCSRIQGTL